MSAADVAESVLVAGATAFLAWTGVRAGLHDGVVAGLILVGVILLALQWRVCQRHRSQPARCLRAAADGSLWLHTVGQPACRATVGRGTRLLGPSVFLDLHVACPGSPQRIQRWISPFDAPEHVLRQWCVVLPRSGRVACT